MFAFRHGLSYTKFKYPSARLDRIRVGHHDTLHVGVDVTNIGPRDSDEVVQVYFRHLKSAVPQPREALCGFRPVSVRRGKTVSVTINVPVRQIRYWDTLEKRYIVEPGRYEILVGGASDDIRARLPLDIVASAGN